MDKTRDVFLQLVKTGLWEGDVQLLSYGQIDYSAVYSLAEDQGVTGLVAAALEHVTDMRPAKKDVVQFIGRSVQMEQRNQAMNDFIGMTVGNMRREGIYVLLVKGQGVAQCYERPLWRPSGDVDFLLNRENYQKAKAFLLAQSSGSKQEERYSQHLGISIDPWYLEIHGTLRTGLSGRVDTVVDEVQDDVFSHGNVRVWRCGTIDVYLPAPDNDVFLVFTHFIKHFYKGGAVLRQFCDWVRLLWTYQDKIDISRLKFWVSRAGLIGEWKAFAALAVNQLGMPKDAMPLYAESYRNKGERLLDVILNGSTGNKVRDTFKIAMDFPWKAFIYSPSIFLNVNALKITERILGSHD